MIEFERMALPVPPSTTTPLPVLKAIMLPCPAADPPTACCWRRWPGPRPRSRWGSGRCPVASVPIRLP